MDLCQSRQLLPEFAQLVGAAPAEACCFVLEHALDAPRQLVTESCRATRKPACQQPDHQDHHHHHDEAPQHQGILQCSQWRCIHRAAHPKDAAVLGGEHRHPDHLAVAARRSPQGEPPRRKFLLQAWILLEGVNGPVPGFGGQKETSVVADPECVGIGARHAADVDGDVDHSHRQIVVREHDGRCNVQSQEIEGAALVVHVNGTDRDGARLGLGYRLDECLWQGGRRSRGGSQQQALGITFKPELGPAAVVGEYHPGDIQLVVEDPVGPFHVTRPGFVDLLVVALVPLHQQSGLGKFGQQSQHLLSARDVLIEIAKIRPQVLQVGAMVEVLDAVEHQRHGDGHQQHEGRQSEEEQEEERLVPESHGVSGSLLWDNDTGTWRGRESPGKTRAKAW